MDLRVVFRVKWRARIIVIIKFASIRISIASNFVILEFALPEIRTVSVRIHLLKVNFISACQAFLELEKN